MISLVQHGIHDLETQPIEESSEMFLISVYLGRVLKLSKVSLIIKVVIRIKFNIIFSLIE